jgi:2-iminobutanoate/2-iminopropanoate deaminase
MRARAVAEPDVGRLGGMKKMKQVINLAGHSKNNPYLSRAVKFGNLLFVSATAGRNPYTGQFPGADMESQARQAMENLKEVLEEAGTSLSYVLKNTCYLVDIKQKDSFDRVYKEYFPEDPPARFVLQLLDRGTGNLLEIETIAGIPDEPN